MAMMKKSKKQNPDKNGIRTTVVFTADAERILQGCRNSYGLKGPLSVGICLFDELPVAQKQQRITEAHVRDQKVPGSKPVHTSVVFTAAAALLVDKYKPAFGKKGPLSVGLELFSALSDEQKFRWITQVENEDQSPESWLKLMAYAGDRLLRRMRGRITAEDIRRIQASLERIDAQLSARTVVDRASAEAPRPERRRKRDR